MEINNIVANIIITSEMKLNFNSLKFVIYPKVYDLAQP